MLLLTQWQRVYMRLKLYSEFDTCRRIGRMIGSQIGDIVVDDPPEDTISTNDMEFEEVNNIDSFNFSN